MIVRKILLTASAVTLMGAPAWALANQMPANHPGKTGQPNHPAHPSHPGHPSHPNHPGHPSHPGNPGNPSKPHNCTTPHNVAYIVSGTLVSQTLSKNPDGTYSGTLEVEVTHTNNHAVKGKTSYPVSKVHVTFDNGSVGLVGVTTGDRVKAIGKITTLSKKCSQTGFTAVITIRKIVFHKP